jgi:hypothetical protein
MILIGVFRTLKKMKIFSTSLFVLILLTLFKSYKTEKLLYSFGEYTSTGMNATTGPDRLIPGLTPLPEPKTVTQIAASSQDNHVLILINSLVYSFGRNDVRQFNLKIFSMGNLD